VLDQPIRFSVGLPAFDLREEEEAFHGVLDRGIRREMVDSFLEQILRGRMGHGVLVKDVICLILTDPDRVGEQPRDSCANGRESSAEAGRRALPSIGAA